MVQTTYDTGTGPVTAAIVRVIKLAIALVTTAIWLPVGLAFWVPVLTRSTAVFSVMVLYVALTRTDPRAVHQQLDHAIGFYPRGFRHIWDIVQDPAGTDAEAPSLGRVHILYFVLEIVWALIFWGGITLLLYRVTLLPAPVQEWLAATIAEMRKSLRM